MTQPVVQASSTETPTSANAPPNGAPANAAPASPPEAASPVKTPEQLAAEAAQKEVEAKEQAKRDRIERLRDKTRTSAQLFREKQARKEAQKQAEATEAQRQADLARLSEAKHWEEIKSDKRKAFEHLESIGFTHEDFGEFAMKRGTPAEIIAQAEQRAEAKARKMLEDAEAARKKQDEERAKEAETAAQHRALRAFVHQTFSAVGEDKAKLYPALTYLYSHVPHVLAEKAESLTKTALQKGYHLEDHEIAELLEEQAKPEYNKKRDEWLATHSTQSGSTPSNQPAATSTPNSAARAPVVTNETGNGPSLPENFDKLSDKEKTAWYATRYNQLVEQRKR